MLTPADGRSRVPNDDCDLLKSMGQGPRGHEKEKLERYILDYNSGCKKKPADDHQGDSVQSPPATRRFDHRRHPLNMVTARRIPARSRPMPSKGY